MPADTSGKIPFAQLCIQVDKLYEKEIPITDTVAIDEQCLLIEGLIIGAGYTTDEYIYKLGQDQSVN